MEIVLQNIRPEAIEAESFRIIEAELGPTAFGPAEFSVVRRVIHATGDFSFRDNLCFHPGAMAAGLRAIRAGKNVLTDVTMAAAGVSQSILARFGGTVLCGLNDPEVAAAARATGRTRSEVAMAKAVAGNIGIVVVGNAPTALLQAMAMIDQGLWHPDLVIGVPVGFVNAAESKQILAGQGYPFITALGRKGGSPVAAAIVNALLRLAEEDR